MHTLRLGLLSVLFLASCSSRSTERVDRAPAEIVGSLARAFSFHPAETLAFQAALPEDATGALRLGIDAETWLEVRPLGVHAAPRTDEQGVAVYGGALDDGDLVYVREKARVEELRLVRTRASAATSRWDVRLGPKLAGFRVKDGRVEAWDGSGAVRFVTEPAWAADAKGIRRPLSLRLEGTTLVGSLDVEGMTPPIAIDPAWSTAANLTVKRAFPMVAKLSTGKILVAGGSNETQELSTSELYDPATNTFTASAAVMSTTRNAMNGGFAVMDGGKRVIMTEGRALGGGISADADIYDATTDSMKKVLMPMPSRGHSTTLLKDGKVALIGGRDETTGNWLGAIRVFDPASDNWTTYNPMIAGGNPLQGRYEHCSIVLSDGKVLTVGGKMSSGPSGSTTVRLTDDTWIWDPTTPNSWAPRSRLPTGRSGHACYVLSRGTTAGKVMALGGFLKNLDETGTIPSSGSMVYDPVADTWVLGPLFSKPRSYFSSVMLGDGRILVSGGTSGLGTSFTAEQTAEVFDGSAWVVAGSMLTPRGAHGSILLSPKKAMMIGGAKEAIEGVPTFLATTETFTLQDTGAACSAPGECDSGFCVDGVCCSSACTGQCAACDLTGSVGTCKAVKGAPRGKRAACEAGVTPDACSLACDGTDTTACKYPTTATSCGTATCAGGVETHVSTCDGAGKCKDVPKSCGDFVCGGDACKTACTTKADCVNPNHFCSYGKCIPVGANGATCTGDDACASGTCVDGVCCESKCNGQCEACDVPGQLGRCVAIKGRPHGARSACAVDSSDACKTAVCDGTNTASCAGTVGPCGSYACDATTLACKATCVASTDCAKGYECDGGACVPNTSKCTADLTSVIGTDGKTTSCSPVLCRAGQCLPDCKSSADCQGGFVCDGSGKCIAPTAASTDDSSGGCSTSANRTASGAWLGVLILALAARRRR